MNMKNFLHYCKMIDFGKVKLSKMESTFYRRFSNEIFSLCRSLPESVQTDAMLFLLQYSGVKLVDGMDFFANYYPPAWSIIYWLSHDHLSAAKQLKKGDVANAVTAQSMAMFLHSLDDHLIDGQVSVSPVTLLLRSQAWTIMNKAFWNLAEGVPGGEETVRRFIDDYYSSIHGSKGPKSLDSYCDLFRRQMAIGMIVPILLSMKRIVASDFTRDMEIAFGSFGVAWRLLDDIRDIGEDIKKGTHSGICLCLPKEMRTHWGNNPVGNRDEAKGSTKAILNHILEHGLIDKIKKRICAELETAASMVETYRMKGLAREFRCLAHPLKETGSPQEVHGGRQGLSQA